MVFLLVCFLFFHNRCTETALSISRTGTELCNDVFSVMIRHLAAETIKAKSLGSCTHVFGSQRVKAVVPLAQTRRIILRDTPVSMGIR